jgi:hypothetical protein
MATMPTRALELLIGWEVTSASSIGVFAQERQAGHVFRHVPQWYLLEAVGALGLVVLGLLVWGCTKPAVGRVFARVFSVIALGAGVGVLTWGIVAASLGQSVRSPLGWKCLIAEPSEAIGLGAGLLAAGVTALVLSLVGRKRPP